MLSERGHTQKSHSVWFHLYEITTADKSTRQKARWGLQGARR